jgi:hypothetical protein
MTQLRHCKCGASNLLDEIERDIGHRGSSFMDFDAVSHDMRTHRFLVRELKRPNEALNAGERITLRDLALEPRFTVWYLQLWSTGEIAWIDMRVELVDVISKAEYRERVRAWWDGSYRLENYIQIADELPRRRA